ncbi:MAG: DUF4389 domain-containing protein [Gammaproteobacteria bacterium]|nr:DUF4389 domain-containing protein [Gammaproteobacteria bacterium]
MSEDYKQNIKEQGTWMRGLNILLFTIIYSVTEMVIALVVLFQFLSVLFTRQTNEQLLDLGQRLSTYVFQILRYVTFNSDDRPFPFSDFPATEGNAAAGGKKKAAKKKVAKKKEAEPDADKPADKPAE